MAIRKTLLSDEGLFNREDLVHKAETREPRLRFNSFFTIEHDIIYGNQKIFNKESRLSIPNICS